MSLIELMIGVLISSVVIAGAGAIFVYSMSSFVRIVDQNDAEEQLLSAAYVLRLVATQAVDLQGVAAIGAGGGAGQIVNTTIDPVTPTWDFDSEIAPWNNANEAYAVAIFKRQVSPDDAALPFTLANSFQATGIYFRNPPASAGGALDVPCLSSDDLIRCSGQLILNLGARGAGGVPSVLPAAAVAIGAPVSFSHFVSLKVQTTTVANASPSYAKEATFRLTVRYFLGGSRTDYDFRFAPNLNRVRGYRDKSLDVIVGFRNNYLGPSQLVASDAERLHSSLYYFPFRGPNVGF